MKEYRHIAVAVVLLLAQLCAASAFGDTVDDIVMAEKKRQYSSGVAIAIVKNGRPVKVAGYGHIARIRPTSAFT